MDKRITETSAKMLSSSDGSLNKSIWCRAGALACNIQPGAAVLHDFCRGFLPDVFHRKLKTADRKPEYA
jgi:hypothetical protein